VGGEKLAAVRVGYKVFLALCSVLRLYLSPVNKPFVTYIIASMMRTGSYLLCEGLEATGRAGHPREIFCPERVENYAGEWLLPPGVGFEPYLLAAIKKGTTENGVFGFKIHGHHVEPLARERGVVENPWQVLRQLFPDAKYIHLTRRNRRAQAISWYRAVVTNEWWRIPGVPHWELTGKQPEFNGREIRRMEIELDRQEKAWDVFFATKPGEVIAMDYETLASDYRNQVARVLALMGEDPDLAKALPEPRMVRQADDTSEEWQRRMDAEFALTS
jgi:trehalose 2-sulfotransferase